MKIVLASKSPRRQELLKRVVDKFEVIESNFDEDSIKFSGNPDEYVKELSMGKALSVAKTLTGPYLVIAADTIVFYGGEVLGKPKNYNDAYGMLCALSGNTHKVYSGICIIDNNNNIKSESCVTYVKFSHISKERIENYIKSEEPMDKAGAYGIQGLGGTFVEEIKGCYHNVMGLPINRVNELLADYNVTLL